MKLFISWVLLGFLLETPFPDFFLFKIRLVPTFINASFLGVFILNHFIFNEKSILYFYKMYSKSSLKKWTQKLQHQIACNSM